tara:strand:+ start:1034 stop:2029 length:996 start_codon:yes stop_codon:yes gene_type:complete
LKSKPSFKDIIEAKDRINKFIVDTPIVSSSILNDWLGHRIFFKADSFQKIGAFKSRGASNAISFLVEEDEKPKRIVANSSGNHAQAVAWASSQFGIPSTIFMPDYASKIKIQATRSYGAEVVLSPTRDESDDKVLNASRNEGVCWLPPFNNTQVIAGQGTATLEALRKLKSIDAVFAPCGGGGLLSGALITTRKMCPSAKVIGAEPLNANDAVQSVRMNSIQRLKGIPNTIADGAMTMAVGDITFEFLKKLDEFYEVEEEKIIYWTQWLNHLLKIQIEPTCAMTMDAAFRWLKKQSQKKEILIIISGGNVDDITRMKIWKQNHLNITPNDL